MEEKPNRTSWWITIVVALPVLYVLSVGPVAWVLMNQLHTNASDWLKIYYPLWWLADHSPAFRSAITAYLYLWGIGE